MKDPVKYNLHDCDIDAVTLNGNQIVFSFPDGYYAEDDNCQEIKSLRRKLVFTIGQYQPDESLDAYIEIRRISRNFKRWREISFKEFTALFKKGNMTIHDEYDSKLTNWKMIQLNADSRSSNIELWITDIIDVQCIE